MLDLQPGVHLEEDRSCGPGRRRTRPCRPNRSRPPWPARPPARPSPARVAASSNGEGASSITFWFRRWIEHSRSPRWMTLPCLSPSTWISMWRGSIDELLDEDPVVAEARRRPPSAAGRSLRATSAVESGDAHALAAAAGRSLDHHRIADLGGDLHRLVRVGDDARDGRAPSRRRPRPRASSI